MRRALNRRMILLAVAAAAVIGATAAPSIADARGPLYGSTWPSKVTGKLWRGVGNTAFCWVEIPVEINREWQNTDPFTGTIQGFVQGLWFTVRRLGLGIADVVTFPVDIYSNNYQSIQREAFPFIDEVE
jgi:putative exosortase-associated protein (TIGR04073 family)